MKKILYLASIFLLTLVGCNDDAFLREDPKGFLTIENSYLNAAQFRTGLNQFYFTVRQNYNFADDPNHFSHFGAGTDLFFRPTNDADPFSDWTFITPSFDFYRVVYGRHYGLIANINNLLQQSENPAVRWNSEEEKLAIQAEAHFFRGYAYRYLGCMFGGVPIIKDPVAAPSLSYTRNTRAEVYDFCVQDFEFAAKHLPQAASEPGRVVKAAAYHYLAEMYIALADEQGKDKALYQKAVDAASMVLDGKVGDYRLMTERHGWRKDIQGKDAFWDLFQMRSTGGFSNHSYQTGNKESVWVIQVDKYLTGGLNDGLSTRTDQERVYWPSFWSFQKFGWGNVARDWTGRGIGWLRPTDFFSYTLWGKSGPEDQRNSETNINRIFRSPDPIIGGKEVANYDTTYITKVTLVDGTNIEVKTKPGDIIKREWLTTRQDTMERAFPRIMKLGSDWHYNQDPSNGFVMEFYAIRLPETYFVRAEAYMKLGDNGKAAADLNVVRDRASAKHVTPGEVNIDYILDERARELVGEELRTLTLCRLGLLYERTKKYGYASAARTVQERNNLCPIPQSVIDANSQAEFPNNPGFN